MKIKALFIGFFIGLASLSLLAQTAVYQIDLFKPIDPAAWRHVKIGLQKAKESKADYVLLHINTYGGMVDYADSIRTALLQFDKPVLAFIDNNAASAGALISIACDSIYMRKSASIGSASVVNQNGEVMPDKYQSYMRATMRATAEATGRDPDIAEAMVGKPSSDSTGKLKVLALTASEAMAQKYCNGTAESVDEVLKKAGIEKYVIQKYEPTTIDNIINFLISPAISAFFILMIVGGLYFELQSPGIGFPIIVAITGALLYFAPLYIEGLAENWEILLFVAGLILLLVEIFVIPGFGVAGIGGILLMIVGLTLSLTANDGFDFNPQVGLSFTNSLALVTVMLVVSTFGSIWLGGRLLQTTMFNPMMVNVEQHKEQGYIGIDMDLFNKVGKQGIAHTVLRPSGKVLIEEVVYDATSELAYIERGKFVEVIRFENNQLVVREME